MKGGKRALTSWNKFVKKVYSEGKSENDSYSFQEALKDASRRKSEMGAAPVAARGTKKSRKSARRNSKRSMAAQAAGTRRRRRH
jgi:hypothetical protein